MTDKTSADRIDALEMRATYQEESIEALNQVVTAQWKQIDSLMRQIAELGERLREAEAGRPATASEPPPHD
ncbi:MAG: hypothetical protein K0Q64_124 [Nitrobacter vulgaris]|nr:hypothetical protein [Nitrobacter vulgaris]